MLGICTLVPENFTETNFACWIIQVDDVINRAKYFFNRFTQVSNFVIFSAKRRWPLQLL